MIFFLVEVFLGSGKRSRFWEIGGEGYWISNRLSMGKTIGEKLIGENNWGNNWGKLSDRLGMRENVGN